LPLHIGYSLVAVETKAFTLTTDLLADWRQLHTCHIVRDSDFKN
jgi:hypothetical protein